MRRTGSGKAVGEEGEKFAAAFLKRSGYRILETNFRDRSGEIDVVALDRGTVCFVEVKTRRAEAAVGPEESVDARKIRRIVRASRAYRAKHRLDDVPVRFDVVAVRVGEDGAMEASLTPGAFLEDGWG
ncbi:MAG: YraN family protein [Planctomycetes bacterium]|jgi:putative endonuclease|nr:YraN family protein [Planctomycetota bacterium]